MISRIIITGKNSEMPRRAASNPAREAAARPASLPVGRAASPFLPPRVFDLARGNLARSLSDRAPSFDATHDVWIVPPSGTQPDAVAAAEQRQPTSRTHTSLPSPAPSTPISPGGAGQLDAAITALEAVTVALGLTVFGTLAYVMLVLA